MIVSLVVAVAENGVIGAEGSIPWDLPEDLAHFKETTMGHPVIVGRRTYESIVDRLGEPLPGRLNVVLSTRDLDLPEGAVQARGIEDALDVARETGTDEVFVIGGRTVYEAVLPRTDRLYFTEIHDSYEGDTTFPDWDHSAFREIDRDDRNGFSFVVYERVGE
ncbi:MAG: dihydrofolate reductase [Halodesulfurarchaeum sp.]